MTNTHRMKKNYNWAKATLVMGCMLGLGWLATPVMARDMDVRLMDEDTTIMVVAEVQPDFNGNLNQWIGENVQYPEEAYANQIDGRVFVTFVIEKDGAVSHVRVVRSAHPLLDAEALRVSPECRNGNRLCREERLCVLRRRYRSRLNIRHKRPS